MRDENTYIKLYRKIETNKLLSKDNDAFIMFIKILLGCDWENGIFLTGRFELAKLCNLQPRRAYSKLILLKKYGFITVKSTNKHTEITVINWSKYQQKSGQQSDNKVTTKRKKVDSSELLLNDIEVDNKRTNSGQQSDNKVTLFNNKELKSIELDKSNSSAKLKKEKIWKYDENDKRLAELLFKLIHDNGHFTEKALQDKNIDIIRLMRVSDKRKPEEIEYVIVWSQKDQFWSGVILSTEGLRRNFSKMATQIMRNNKSSMIVKI